MSSTTSTTVSIRRDISALRDALRNRGDFAISTRNLRGQARLTLRYPLFTGRLPAEYSDSAQSADYVVFSYDTPIAWHLAGQDAERDEAWIVPGTPYSRTTTQHQTAVSDALYSLPGNYVYISPDLAPTIYDSDGYNSEGYDRYGYNRYGYNEDGYDSDGYNEDGYDEDGYNSDGYNEDGYNSDGYNSDGYDRYGYNEDGYNEDGYDSDGYNRYGYNEDGYNRDGYNEDGYDSDGYNEDGYNSDGYNEDEMRRPLVAGQLDASLAYAARSANYSPAISALSSRMPGNVALLAGAAVWPATREMIDRELDIAWARERAIPSFTVPEVIIGAGVHAAIYSAIRVANGKPKPLVLERSDRVGGTFAITRRPSFYLNSGNYPGLLGRPGQGQALNYLPGAEIQPSDVSSAQYGTNADIGFIVRATLARYADVVTSAGVRAIGNDDYESSELQVRLTDGRLVYARRVLDARGLGDPIIPDGAGMSERVITFPDLLRRFDGDFPLQGIRRAAIIGGGDSGKVSAECLLGIGPQASMSVGSLDYLDRVDIYGPQLADTATEWYASERSRYSQVGSFLKTRRLSVIRERARVVDTGTSVLVNEQSYDTVIVAAGFTLPDISSTGTFYSRYESGNGLILARKAESGAESYRIGPAAALPFTDAEEREPAVISRAENVAGIFRYAARTAALAASLD